jgi:hypothetical protein
MPRKEGTEQKTETGTIKELGIREKQFQEQRLEG